MNLLLALCVVRDLANENVIEPWQAEENDIEEARQEQLEAIEAVDSLIALVRGKDRSGVLG